MHNLMLPHNVHQWRVLWRQSGTTRVSMTSFSSIWAHQIQIRFSGARVASQMLYMASRHLPCATADEFNFHGCARTSFSSVIPRVYYMHMYIICCVVPFCFVCEACRVYMCAWVMSRGYDFQYILYGFTFRQVKPLYGQSSARPICLTLPHSLHKLFDVYYCTRVLYSGTRVVQDPFTLYIYTAVMVHIHKHTT